MEERRMKNIIGFAHNIEFAPDLQQIPHAFAPDLQQIPHAFAPDLQQNIIQRLEQWKSSASRKPLIRINESIPAIYACGGNA